MSLASSEHTNKETVHNRSKSILVKCSAIGALALLVGIAGYKQLQTANENEEIKNQLRPFGYDLIEEPKVLGLGSFVINTPGICETFAFKDNQDGMYKLQVRLNDQAGDEVGKVVGETRLSAGTKTETLGDARNIIWDNCIRVVREGEVQQPTGYTTKAMDTIDEIVQVKAIKINADGSIADNEKKNAFLVANNYPAASSIDGLFQLWPDVSSKTNETITPEVEMKANNNNAPTYTIVGTRSLFTVPSVSQ